MITVSSIFRDAEVHIGRYFDQIDKLRPFVELRLVIAEGDSTDNTRKLIEERLWHGDKLVTCDVGGRLWPNIDDPNRWDQIAKVVRATVQAVEDPGDAFLYVEGDLVWQPETMQLLVGTVLGKREKPYSAPLALAPMVYSKRGMRYYDWWGFRKNGRMFNQFEPYWTPEPGDGPLVKIDSCGSCFAVSTDGWPLVQSWSGVWPFSAEGNLWLDPSLRIEHP